MDAKKQSLKGSPFRDAFKHAHKQPPFTKDDWCIDLDLLPIGRREPLCVLDAKGPNDCGLTQNEMVAYRWFLEHGLPVYILDFQNDLAGPIDVKEIACILGEPPYCRVEFAASVVRVDGIADLAVWERCMRERLDPV